MGLAAYYLDLKVHNWVAVTGAMTLSGDLGGVGGLREKLLGAFRHQMGQSESGSQSEEDRGKLTVVVPHENVVGGVVGETLHYLDGGAARKTRVPKAVRDGLHVQEAADMFTVLALALLPSEEGGRQQLPPLVRPPRPPHSLSLARCIDITDGGGILLVMECALLQPGSGNVVHTSDAQVVARGWMPAAARGQCADLRFGSACACWCRLASWIPWTWAWRGLSSGGRRT